MKAKGFIIIFLALAILFGMAIAPAMPRHNIWSHKSQAGAIAKPAPEYVIIGGKRYSTSLTELFLSPIDLQSQNIASLRQMTNLTSLSLISDQISDLSRFTGE